jgi:Tfp pilus assembly protein PilF
MRLALGERYYEAGDYRSAFPHFLAVAESPQATDSQAVTALIRLGWMAWEGNSQVDTALGLFDQALAIDTGSTTARYLKGKVLWCGAGQARDAARMFEEVLSDPTLDDEARSLVETDLAAVTSGASCP